MVTFHTTNDSSCTPSLFSVNSSSCYVLPSYFIACSMGFNVLVSLPANGCILWRSMKEMNRGQSSEIFVFNLALVEIIFCTSFVPIVQQYFFSCTSCKSGVYFPGLVLMVGRPLFLSCICVERYLGVLHPVIFLKLKPIRYRVVFCSIGWVLVVSSSLVVTVGIIQLHQLVLPACLFFFSLKVYSCLMVLRALKRPGPGDLVRPKDGGSQDKAKAFRIIRIVLVSSVLMYGPMIISLVLYYLIDLQRFLLSWSAALWLGIMFGLVQPFLYLNRDGTRCVC